LLAIFTLGVQVLNQRLERQLDRNGGQSAGPRSGANSDLLRHLRQLGACHTKRGQTNDLQFATALIFPLFVVGLGRLGRPHGSKFSVLKVVLAISILATLFLAGALTALSNALMTALWFCLQVKLPQARPLQYWEGTLTSPGSSPPNASELPNKPEQNPTRL